MKRTMESTGSAVQPSRAAPAATNRIRDLLRRARRSFAIGLSSLLGRWIERRVGTMGMDRSPTGQEFALLLESAPNGVVLVDSEGRILLTNAQLERTFGYGRSEMIGQPVEMLIPGVLQASHVRLRQVFAARPEFRSMGIGRDILGRHKDGSEFPIEIGLNPIVTESGRYVMATVADITPRVRTAKALNDAIAERDRLRRRLMKASEDERLRLARELHDQTGQPLIAASLAAKDLEKSLDADGRQKLQKLNSLLDLIGRTLHQVAWDLRPASIDDLGVKATLSNYVADWSAQIGIDAEFLCEDIDIDGLPDETRTTIFRVVQEALTNIAKHATGTSKVSVVVKRSGAVLQLTIDDRGDGFDPEAQVRPSKLGALGIPGMRERLALIGGMLEIESSLGFGTTVYARMPMPSEENVT